MQTGVGRRGGLASRAAGGGTIVASVLVPRPGRVTAPLSSTGTQPAATQQQHQQQQRGASAQRRAGGGARRPLAPPPAAAHKHASGATVRHGNVVAPSSARFAIVVARFNDLVTKLLLEGALGAFESHGADMAGVEVCWVPGSFELPVVAKAMAKSGKYDAVVAIGVVVRGATTHYDAVVSAATSGVLNAGVDTGVPIVFGVLTCDTMEQALDRAGGKVGNKGGEAAITAIETANLLADLRGAGLAAAPWIAK